MIKVCFYLRSGKRVFYLCSAFALRHCHDIHPTLPPPSLPKAARQQRASPGVKTTGHLHGARSRRSLATSRRSSDTEMSLNLVIKEFSKLGFIAFGGPPAHVALMLKRFAEPGSLEWISGESFAQMHVAQAFGRAAPPTARRCADRCATLRLFLPRRRASSR